VSRPLRHLLTALAAVALLAGLATSSAAFTSSSGRTGTWTADVLDPASGLSAVRTCPVAPAPTFRSSKVATSLASSVTVQQPNGLAVDDVMLAFATSESSTAITGPDGWTRLHDVNPGTGRRGAVFWKRATASEPSGYTFSWGNGGLVTVVAYSGVNTVTALDGSDVSATSAATTSAVAPSLTTSSAETRLVFGVWAKGNTAISSPSSVTVQSSHVANSSILIMGDEKHATTGTSGTRTFTYTTAENNMATTVALRGISSGGSSSVELAWTMTPDGYAAGYELVRDSGSPTTISGRTTQTYTDTTTDASTPYSYSLRASAGSWRSTAVTASVTPC
jgi:hypothetical protein